MTPAPLTATLEQYLTSSTIVEHLVREMVDMLDLLVLSQYTSFCGHRFRNVY
jgi:hypothetical protein